MDASYWLQCIQQIGEEQKRIVSKKHLVILDMDESLGSFAPSCTVLIALAHLLSCDPLLKEKDLGWKLQALEELALTFVPLAFRPGAENLVTTLYGWKGVKIQRIVVMTRARCSRETLFSDLKTSPQELLLRAVSRQYVGTEDLIDEIVFIPSDQKKDLREYQKLYSSAPIWVVDDLSFEKNYLFEESSLVSPFRVQPFFGFENVLAMDYVTALMGCLRSRGGECLETLPRLLHTVWKNLKDLHELQRTRRKTHLFLHDGDLQQACLHLQSCLMERAEVSAEEEWNRGRKRKRCVVSAKSK
jgi:hypothetical protein